MSYETLEAAVQTLVTTNSALVAAVTGTQQEASTAIIEANQSAVNALASESEAKIYASNAQSSSVVAGNKALEASDSAILADSKAADSANSAAAAAAVVTGGTASFTPAPGKIPLADSNGKIDDEWLTLKQGTGKSKTKSMSQWAVTNALSGLAVVGDIGSAGKIGFGVGIAPALPDGMSEMSGTRIIGHDNYGNYQESDGSVLCWIPSFFYRYGHADNATYATYGVNSVNIVPRSAYPTVLAAAVAGYALHRAFWDDGIEQPGVFVDKYKCSNNGGIASSIKNGNSLSSSAAHYPFSSLSGGPANNLSGAITAAKTRGVDYFPGSLFITGAMALLALAHAQAATSQAACAWYDSTGVSNFPKGCNNNALRDANDTTVLYESTGHETYPTCGKTGSGVPFAKTTHNGQACGVADVNGLIYEINLGITVQDGNYYILDTEARMADLTPGTTLNTDAWGLPGIAANYLMLGANHQALGSSVGNNFAIGSANQVFSGATEGNDWAAACAGIPNLDGTGGTNLFGNDRFYDNNPQHMCMASAGFWNSSTNAGPWIRNCHYSRSYSHSYYGFRSALYLVKKSDSE